MRRHFHALSFVAVALLHTAARAMPTLALEQKLLAPDRGFAEYLGSGLALTPDGTRLVASAPSRFEGGVKGGAVFVWLRAGATWTLEATLTASDRTTDDDFGTAVAISADGTRLVVGAFAQDEGALDANGAGYVFVRSGSTWTQEAKLLAADRASSDALGIAVAISADGARVALGARQAPGTGRTGGVYVFARAGTSWSQEARIVGSNTAVGDFFGSAVDLDASASRLVVGALRSAGTSRGAAYVFHRSGTTWSEEAALALDATLGGGFGQSVSVAADGATLAVGATTLLSPAGDPVGGVVVFVREGTSWSQSRRFGGSDGAAGDQLGAALDLAPDGQALLVGAPRHDHAGLADAGRAYLFRRYDATWVELAAFGPLDAASLDYFGAQVALGADGRRIAGASPSESDPSGAPTSANGAVFTYGVAGAIPLVGPDLPYRQAFDGLAASGTSSLLPFGWALREVGTNKDDTYAADTGGSNAANTYSFGAGGASERALGTLASGSLTSSFGAAFVNDSAEVIEVVDVAFTGEWWRRGTDTTRADPLQLAYSTDATDLGGGTWIRLADLDVDHLDMPCQATAACGAIGGKDGNTAPFRQALGGTIAGLAIDPGATFWLRWLDSDAVSGDEGLAVDDVVITPRAPLAPTVTVEAQVTPELAGPVGPGSALSYYARVAVAPDSPHAIDDLVVVHTLPPQVSARTSQQAFFSVLVTGQPEIGLTPEAGDDIGELAGRVATVHVGHLDVGSEVWIRVDVLVGPLTQSGTLTSTVDATWRKADRPQTYSGGATSAQAVVKCVLAPSGPIPLCPGTVSVWSFFDTNGDGTQQADEPYVGGWTARVGAAQVTTLEGFIAQLSNMPAGVELPVEITPPAAQGTYRWDVPATISVPPGLGASLVIAATCTCEDGDDGDLCTVGDTCYVGACGGGAPRACVDGDVCSDDTCVPATGCHYPPNTAACDDEDTTTRDDRCGGGTCAGTPYTCTPASACETATPDGVGCTTAPTNAGGGCDDGRADTRDDVCDAAGRCGGTPFTCTPAGPCVQSSTPDGEGCTVVPQPTTVQCDDGLLTTREDRCDGAGACAGTPYTCPTGPCVLLSTPNGSTCVEIVNPAPAPCDDGQASTRDDMCAGGACVGTPYTCTPASVCETSAPDGAGCVATPVAPSVTCNDGKITTRDDHCDGAGVCVGTAYTCTPGPCEATSVPDGAGCVVAYAVGAGCDDGDPCTLADACGAAGGCSGVAVVCEEDEVCQGGACIAIHCAPCEVDDDCVGGASCEPLAAGGRCLVPCEGDDACAAGQTCAAGAEGDVCWDDAGACAIDVVPADPGPEPGPEPTPEVVEPEPDTIVVADTTVEDATDPGDSSVPDDVSATDATAPTDTTTTPDTTTPTDATSADAADTASSAEEGRRASTSDDGCTGGGSAGLAAALALLLARHLGRRRSCGQRS